MSPVYYVTYVSGLYPKVPPPVAHAIAVGNLSIFLGLKCDITNDSDLSALGVAGFLHDVGKTILDKNYYIRQNEIPDERLKSYPLIGTDMLKSSGEVSAEAIRTILEHRERLDGSGFPSGMTGNCISRLGRIVGICDYFDEATNSKDSKNSRPPFEALMNMRKEKRRYDQEILTKLIHLLSELS